jgi:hypothetical protein
MSTPKTNFCHCLETASVAVLEGHFGTCNIVDLWRISANKASSSIIAYWRNPLRDTLTNLALV